jgi:hypothetical protein
MSGHHANSAYWTIKPIVRPKSMKLINIRSICNGGMPPSSRSGTNARAAASSDASA